MSERGIEHKAYFGKRTKPTKAQQPYVDVFNSVPEQVLARELGFKVIGDGCIYWESADACLRQTLGAGPSPLKLLWDKCCELYFALHPELEVEHAKKLAALRTLQAAEGVEPQQEGSKTK